MDLAVLSDLVVITVVGLLFRHSTTQNTRIHEKFQEENSKHINSLADKMNEVQQGWTSLREDVHVRVQEILRIASSNMDRQETKEYVKELTAQSNEVIVYRLDKLEEAVDTLVEEIKVLVRNGKQN